jgi:hypothetical protein
LPTKAKSQTIVLDPTLAASTGFFWTFYGNNICKESQLFTFLFVNLPLAVIGYHQSIVRLPPPISTTIVTTCRGCFLGKIEDFPQKHPRAVGMG